MGGEGHGRGARAGADRQGADAARRTGRPARQADQSGADEGAAVLSAGRHWIPNDGRATMKRLAVAIVLTALFATAAAAQQLSKVQFGFDGYAMTSGPLNYADKQGLFKRFGLDLTPIYIEG